MSFQAGDVVQLKSGGPLMTVVETNDPGMVSCIWFNSENVVQEKAFSEDTLKIYQKPNPRIFRNPRY